MFGLRVRIELRRAHEERPYRPTARPAWPARARATTSWRRKRREPVAAHREHDTTSESGSVHQKRRVKSSSSGFSPRRAMASRVRAPCRRSGRCPAPAGGSPDASDRCRSCPGARALRARSPAALLSHARLQHDGPPRGLREFPRLRREAIAAALAAKAEFASLKGILVGPINGELHAADGIDPNTFPATGVTASCG